MTQGQPNPPTRARITQHHGDRDAIRWGNVWFPDLKRRRFQHDLLTDNLTLFHHPHEATCGLYRPDTDPERLQQTREALARRARKPHNPHP